MKKDPKSAAPKKKPVSSGNRGGNSSAILLPPKSEGQRLLLLQSDSLAVIARAASVSRPCVLRWQRGERRPESDARRYLCKMYRIPIEAWDEPPGSPDEALADNNSPSGDDPDIDAPASSAAHYLELIRNIRKIKLRLSPSDQLKANKDEGGLRTLHDRALEKVAREWDRRIREDPQWREFEDVLMRVLDRYPEVKAEVLAVFEKHGP